MKKGFAIALLLGSLAWGGGVAHAQDSDQTVSTEIPAIGFVLLSRVFRESQYVAKVRTDIEEDFSDREQALQAKITQFNELRSTRQQGQLTQVDLSQADAGSNITELEREIKREDRDLAEDKRSRFDAANIEVERTISKKIREVASERKIFLVVELSSVLFAEKRLDLTDDVIASLDQEDPQAESKKTSQGQ